MSGPASNEPEKRKEHKRFKFTFDDVVYSQRLFFVMLALLIGVLIFNPWVLHEAERADEERDKEQTDHLLRNSERQFNATTTAIEKLDQAVVKVDTVLATIIKGQQNANLRGNLTMASFNETLEHIDEQTTTINQTVVEEAAKEANLTKAETEELVDGLVVIIEDILPNLNKTIPALQNQSSAMLNATNEIREVFNFLIGNFNEEYLIDEVRQYGQSNATHGNLTVINDKLDRLLANSSR